MPVYSYICKDCKEKFDLFIGISPEDDKLACKKCGSKNIQRIFSSFGVVSSPDKDSGSDSPCPTGTCPFN